MNRKQIQSNLMLVLVALIWGTAFVFQAMGGDSMSAYAFNALRSLAAGIALLPLIAFNNAKQKKSGRAAEAYPKDRRTLIVGGIVVGAALAVASALQQLGIGFTTVGKAGFITAMYIVFVPVFGIIQRRRLPVTVWISVALGVVGLYFLSMNGSFTLQKGDALILCCAFGYTAHILLIDHFSPKVDGIKMSCIQFFVCAALSAVFMLIDGSVPTWQAIGEAIIPILYTGVMSSGVGYTLQIIAQKNTEPAVASLLMSLESVFAALAGWVLLNQKFSGREMLGCAIMFAAIVLAQLPDLIAAARKKKGKAA
jgi:drug/metabolite transporter (DMT)-like permease